MMHGRELAALFTPAPAGTSVPMSYRTGVVVEWDAATLGNVINVGGTDMVDLPVLGVGEARLIRPGAVVGLLVVGSGGASTMSIIGRLVIPGTDDAADAVSLLSALTQAANIDTLQGVSATSYTDLATPGPAVTASVGPSGRLLVGISAKVQATGAVSWGGSMTVALSGANVKSALDVAVDYAFSARVEHVLSGGISMATSTNIGCLDVLDGLNTGDTTVTMKYESLYGGAPNADFGNRTVVVMAL